MQRVGFWTKDGAWGDSSKWILSFKVAEFQGFKGALHSNLFPELEILNFWVFEPETLKPWNLETSHHPAVILYLFS
jgi:hypothetical protein